MRTIGAVTASLEDYLACLPVLRRIVADRALELRLVVTGLHLSPGSGHSFDAIAADGFQVAHSLETLLASASPTGEAKSMGIALQAFADCFAASRPDIMMVVGDRYEMMAAALAAKSHRIPVAHLHGGGVGEEAPGNSLRHALSKLSHLHFVATREQARRIRQMGEESWRIEASGAPLLEHLRACEPMTAEDLESSISALMAPSPVLVALEPGTGEDSSEVERLQALLHGIEKSGLPALLLARDDSPGALRQAALFAQHCRQHAEARVIAWPKRRILMSLLTQSVTMVGDTAYGIVLGPTLRLPVVNVGKRQREMERAANVIDAEWQADTIAGALARAASPEFRQGLAGLRNPYGDGLASERIVDRLRSACLDEDLLNKRFFDAWNMPEGVVARTPAKDLEGDVEATLLNLPPEGSVS